MMWILEDDNILHLKINIDRLIKKDTSHFKKHIHQRLDKNIFFLNYVLKKEIFIIFFKFHNNHNLNF